MVVVASGAIEGRVAQYQGSRNHIGPSVVSCRPASRPRARKLNTVVVDPRLRPLSNREAIVAPAEGVGSGPLIRIGVQTRGRLDTVNRGSKRVVNSNYPFPVVRGPGLRTMILDFADLDCSRFMIVPGSHDSSSDADFR